jgi:hypothetical protein
MPASLRATLQRAADDFASGVLRALQSVPLEDIIDIQANGAGRLGLRGGSVTTRRRASKTASGRRSPEDIAKTTERIVALVKKHPKGIKAEEMKTKLGISQNEWVLPLKKALASKEIRKTGQKRSTRYFPR